MNLHLNYDGNQDNGVIYNATYTGCLYEGIELKPKLSFNYYSFWFSEEFPNNGNHVILDSLGTRREMTDEETEEVKTLASIWTQPLGQEGNPTDEQKLESIRYERNSLLSETDYLALSDNTLTPEMVTYRQALRDITVGIDLDNPIYPTKP